MRYADRLPEEIDRLAHHAFQGEMWDKAVVYRRQAGAKAMARSAHPEAVTYFEERKRCVSLLPSAIHLS